MLNSGKKKINILTLVLSGKKILNKTKNHTPPPPCKLNGRSLTALFKKGDKKLASNYRPVRERPFNLKGGYGFFLKKYSDSQCC